jgi:hypothetical protein
MFFDLDLAKSFSENMGKISIFGIILLLVNEYKKSKGGNKRNS